MSTDSAGIGHLAADLLDYLEQTYGSDTTLACAVLVVELELPDGGSTIEHRASTSSPASVLGALTLAGDSIRSDWTRGDDDDGDEAL